MPYRICKTIEIETGHMLSKHADNCRYPHGHSRKVEIILEAAELDQNDMVCDFKAIKDALQDLMKHYDHAMFMNTSDPMYATFKESYGDRVIGLEQRDPTTEVICRIMFDRVSQALQVYRQPGEHAYPVSDDVRLVRVRTWETSTSWAEYEA